MVDDADHRMKNDRAGHDDHDGDGADGRDGSDTSDVGDCRRYCRHYSSVLLVVRGSRVRRIGPHVSGR